MKEFLTCKDVSRLTGYSRQVASQWINTGKLKALKIGPQYRVLREDFERFKQKHLTKADDDMRRRLDKCFSVLNNVITVAQNHSEADVRAKAIETLTPMKGIGLPVLYSLLDVFFNCKDMSVVSDAEKTFQNPIFEALTVRQLYNDYIKYKGVIDNA